jgi:hypothetical protein
MVMQLRNARQSVNSKALAELEAEILEIQRKAGSGQHVDELTWRRKDRMCARVKELKKQQAAAEGHQQAVAGIIEPVGRMIPKEAPQALEFHPLADLFPLMMGNEFGEFVADIKANGLREKITLYEGKILEGRNRYRACREADVKVETDDFEGDETCARAFVISKNIHRRHLDAKQKREIVAALLKANPERSNNATAKMAKVDDKTVGAVRAALERRSEIPSVSTRTDSKGRAQPATKPSRERYTPEVIKQIKNLLERGASREDIATTIGRTTGSLQSACWRLGISLRRNATTTPTPPPPEDTRDNIGPASSGEIARLNARIDELQADKRRLEIENIALRSEIGEFKAVRKPEGEGSELGNLLRAWDRASQGAREEFKARVGLVAVEPPAKVMDDGLDIPECLRRGAP